MDDIDDTQGETLSHKCDVCEHCASTDGARRAQNCALYTSVCFVVSVPLFAMCSRLFMLCVKMYAVCRSHLCIVNVREYEVQDTFPLHTPSVTVDCRQL